VFEVITNGGLLLEELRVIEQVSQDEVVAVHRGSCRTGRSGELVAPTENLCGIHCLPPENYFPIDASADPPTRPTERRGMKRASSVSRSIVAITARLSPLSPVRRGRFRSSRARPRPRRRPDPFPRRPRLAP